MTILSLTADDYGYDRGIDKEIHACLKNGGIDNVSISFDASFDHLAHHELEELRKITVGIHWNLFPLEYDGTRLADLFNLIPASLASQASKKRVFSALDQCLERFDRAGLRPVFFNGHQHVHLLPWWLGPLADWAVKRGVAVFRQPLECGLTRRDGRWRRPELMILEFFGRLARRRTRNKKILWVPSICRWGRTFELEDICLGIKGITLPIVEGMVHPGNPTPEFEKKTRWPLDQRKQAKELSRKDRDYLFLKAGIKRLSLKEYLAMSEAHS